MAGEHAEFVAGFMGGPESHQLRFEQAEALRSWNHDVDVVLYSSESAKVGDLTTEVIEQDNLCGAPQHFCFTRNDNQYLGSVLSVNATHHGFKWFLMGDSASSFMLPAIRRALAKYDHKNALYFGTSVNYPRPERGPPNASYGKLLHECPPLGKSGDVRLVSFMNADGKDATEDLMDCSAMDLHNTELLTWGFADAGHGVILSATLLNSITREAWQKCVDRVLFHGPDIRMSICLGTFGIGPEMLLDPYGCELMTQASGAQQIKVSITNFREKCSDGELPT